MSGFAPNPGALLRPLAPALLLVASEGALAQAPVASMLVETPSVLGERSPTRPYTAADKVASTLLAGGMSQLAAIRAQQGAETLIPWTPAPAIQQTIVNDRRLDDLSGKLPGWQLQGVRLALTQPEFSYRQPDLMPAFMRGLAPARAPASPALGQAQSYALPIMRAPSAPALFPAPRSGQPDVFGSVALSISRSPIDAKWASVSQPLARSGSWSGIVQAARSAGRQQQAEMINRWVNRRLHFVDDRLGNDNWATADRTLERGAGDCEDYAIAKMKLLEAAGFDRHAMFLVIARDLVRRADHAILAVRIGDELMVLDNMTDAVLPSSSVSDYRPILSFNAFGRWTHGYRAKPSAGVQFASR